MDDLKSLADEILDKLMSEFPLRSRPEIVWKPLRVTAGIAYYRVNRIGLSSLLLTTEERLRTTLIHEYAHLLAVQRHGPLAASHGACWKQAMHDLGATPERTHRYEVQRNNAQQQVTYQCKRCGAKIVRARRLSKKRKYVHANCGGRISLLSVERTIISDSIP